jgi:hypothetical protein
MRIKADVIRGAWLGLGRFMPACEAKVTSGSHPQSYSGKDARAELARLVEGKRCVMFLHGYASSPPAIGVAYNELIVGMVERGLYAPYVESAPYEVVIEGYWPGHSKYGYYFAEWSAEGLLKPGSGDCFAEVLADARPASLDLVMHSMGNRVGLDAVRHGLRARNLFMCAAAVDDDCLSSGGEFSTAVETISGKCVVFHSRRDAALASYRFAKLDRALGAYGPQDGLARSASILSVDANEWSDAHSAFRNRPEFYQQWKAQL